MKPVEAIAVGNELLSGDILDTNFREIARRLKDAGVEVGRHVTVADDRLAIADQVRESLSRSDLVVVTGGLGPTPDDLTRFGVADALGVPLVKDVATVERLRERFRRYGVAEMPVTNEVQALFPEGARILPNPNGTAAGFSCAAGPAGRAAGAAAPGPAPPAGAAPDDRPVVFVLPGPPREALPMLDLHLIPFLATRGGLPAIRVRRLRTQGIGESLLAGRIAGWPFGIGGVDLGYYPQDPGVDLKITARAPDEAAAEAALDAAARRLREILSEHVYGEGAVTLAGVVGGVLRSRRQTIAVAESCTGGLLGSLITSVPGSSDYFDGGVITYSDRAKEELLGISRALLDLKGAVSEEVAREMAEGVRRLRGTDLGIALTGVAGPSGGSPEKPVGLVFIALAAADGTEAWRTNQVGNRGAIQRRAAVTALDLLRRHLLRAGFGGGEPA